MIQITGNTYPVKDQLKALGAKWNKDDKCWEIAPDKAEEARKIVAGAPTKAIQTGARKFNPRKCVVCGVVAATNSRGYATIKIYRSGECQDCYEERKMGY